MNEWRYNVNCMIARDLPLEKLGIETFPWDPPPHTYTLGNCKYILAPLLWKNTENLAKLCVFILAFHTTIAAAATSQVKEGKIHGSRSSQGTNSSETHTGWSRDRCSTLSLSSCGPGLGSLRADNGVRYRGRCNQNKVSNNTFWDLILFTLSKPPSISVEHSWFQYLTHHLPFHLSCDISSSRTRYGGKARQWKTLSLHWVWESACK